MDEIELKYSLRQSEEPELRDRLTRTSRFGSFTATPAGEGTHRDTYLDRNGRLQRLGWSLRIRERPDGTRITLKIPRADPRAAAAIEREEIENTSTADVDEVFKDIVARLRAAEVSADGAEVADVLPHGLFGALSLLGMSPLFTVHTNRATWRLSDGGRHVADLVMDTSRYKVHEGEELLEHQVEIELADPAAEHALHAIATDEHGLPPTRTTKFQRGLEFRGATRLKEKIEAKLDLPEPADHETLVRTLRDDPDVISGYRILGQGVERHITDTYYDTGALDLAKAQCYLRIREENGERKLYFRRLSTVADSRLPTQEEIIGVDSANDFSASWKTIVNPLARLLRHSSAGDATDLTTGLRQLGLTQTLRADIVRQAWVVRSSDDGPDSNRYVAKIKVDDVAFQDTTGRRQRHSEIEITGLEDEGAATEYADDDGFYIFMYRFRQLCARRIFKNHQRPDLHIGTKYHAGLRLFGRIDRSLAAFPRGDVLVRQDPNWSDLEPEARSGLLRTALFVALSALGLTSLSGAASGRWQWATLGAGVVLLVAACLVLVRDDSALVSRRTRQRLVVGVSMIGAVIVAVGVGSSTAADLIGLIGFPLTVLGLLTLNSREDPAS
ncbi:CYTH domain-containing protein [Actinoallomurus sp. NPDC052308]|uniref:CYTH domain-containing protein n=1 Tax=Actinoallomurus sp. NPDC052308 TaxID=3155530 RepID=UPI00341AAFC9